MNRILIATTNPAKLAEYRILLRQMEIDLEPVSLADAGITEVAEETGETFGDNAVAVRVIETMLAPFVAAGASVTMLAT